MTFDPIQFLESKLSSLSIDDYEIYLSESYLLSLEVKDGRMESLDEAVERGVAVRLFKKGLCGFSCSSSWETPLLERMIELAYESFSILEPGPSYHLPGDHKVSGKKFSGSSPIVKSQKLEMALAMEQAARSFDPRIQRVRSAQLSEELKSIHLKNSRGLDCQDGAAMYELSMMVVAQEKAEQQMAWESCFSPSFEELQPHQVAHGAAEKAISQIGGVPVKTQRASVVLDSMVATSFLGVLSHSFFADQVQKNRSALRQQLDKNIYSPSITLIDDGRLQGGRSTFSFDGEGNQTQRNALVTQGRLNQFLSDSLSAEEVGQKSTGNAVRSSFKESPHVGATNFFILPQKGSLDHLLQEMGVGFWVRDVIGVHTADPVTGDFSVGASGIWIEGGRRNKPVRGVTLSGNLHRLFKNVVRVGGETVFYDSFGSPPLLIRELDIGGV